MRCYKQREMAEDSERLVTRAFCLRIKMKGMLVDVEFFVTWFYNSCSMSLKSYYLIYRLLVEEMTRRTEVDFCLDDLYRLNR